MNHFFRGYYNDPALGAVMAVALILIVVLSWWVTRDKLRQRRMRIRHQRKRRRMEQSA